jgi:NodT family efflux transporter outer membrane factor (OMF) lipoprotein
MRHVVRRASLTMAPAIALAACTVGPRPTPPAIALPPAAAPQVIAPAAGQAQRLVAGAAPAEWWRSFGSARMDALVTRALAANTDLAVADATLRQARAQARVAGAAGLPQVDASYQAERAKISNALSSPLADTNDNLYTLHTAQVSASYPLDMFGAQRSRIRSARAAAEVAADRLVAARTTVVANLVLACIQHASLLAQVAAAQATIGADRNLVVLLQRRQQLGDIGAADVAAQQTTLAAAEAALPPLERQAQHQAALIAVLTGSAPGGADAPAAADLPTFAEIILPATLPLVLPGDVAAARPDVRAARAQLAGAAADVGTAIAARLPTITLSGAYGGSATRFQDMFAPGNPFYTLIGGVTQPIFHAGALKAQQRAAEAAFDGAKAQYRAAVLQAFTDIDDALTGLRTDAAAVDAADRQARAAAQTLLYTRRQVELGGVGTLNLLNASAADAGASLNVVQARAARLADSVALFQATGGGVYRNP